MRVLFWIGIIYGISIVLDVIIFLYDRYKYPVCLECGHNLKTNWGRCGIHGEIKDPK